MLDGIRANAQSWGVKLAFGIIIIVFVFWGIGSYRRLSARLLGGPGHCDFLHRRLRLPDVAG